MATVTSELLEREAPLRSLHGALEGARHGQGSVVVISGEPGIGKSALVSRFVSDHASEARVLLGICDDLTTPRPLGAFRDVAVELPAPVAEALWDGGATGEFPATLLRELRAGPDPTVLAIEDVHWADQATADVLTVLARRLSTLPVVLILTLRPGELEPDHHLRSALDAMGRSRMLHLELAPLSLAAVAELAGDESDRIYELSRGNPFFVTELLEHGVDPPPPSLANAVLGRVARLEAPAHQLLELVSVVPGRVPVPVLDAAEPGWVSAADQAERRALLTIDGAHVQFRHELTRVAIRSGLLHGRRRLLHRRVLDALLEVGADPAEVVHHAEAAGAADVMSEHALVAARQAAATGSNREAFAHYRRADEFAAPRLTQRERAALFEEFAHTAWLAGNADEALRAATMAIDLIEDLDDTAGHGRLISFRAHVHWFRGDGEAAWRDASTGVRSLEVVGESPELARAYAQLSELSMLVSRAEETLRFGQRALQLAGDDDRVRARALTGIGSMRLQLDIDDVDPLLEAVATATRSGHHEQAVFALVGNAYVNLWWVRPDVARIHAEQARAYAHAQELDGMGAFVDALLAGIDLRQGRPERALALERDRKGTHRPVAGSIADLQARAVRVELAARRGDDDVDHLLGALAEAEERTGKLSRIGHVLELQVERALTCDTPLPVERFEQLERVVGTRALAAGCGAARVAAWATVCGLSTSFSGRAPSPHAAMIAGDWQAAADAFGAVGWAHDRALMLSLLEGAEPLEQALDIARSLGAAPLEERVCRRMRSLGLVIPRGPLASTQANPAQLTDRQLEVLGHVRAGRDNGRIAELLHISPRTVEHHVASIFTKLGVSSRAQAVARCADLELT